MDTVDLAIRMTADATDAAAAADQVGSAYEGMASDVAAASDKADAASRDLSGGADAMASSSAKAAGALGDLGGALEGIPGPLGSVGGGMTALQGPLQAAGGAGDLFALAMQSSALQTAKARAASIAHAAASKAQAAASKALTAGQWLLNAAMAANPIGLAIAAALALVGLFLLLYRRSETFRNAVDAAGDVASKALGFIVDKAKTLGDKVEDLLEPIGGVSGAIETAGELGETAFNLWLTPIRTIIGLVQDLIKFIGDIDFPDLPDVPFLRSGVGGPRGVVNQNVADLLASKGPQVNVTVQGAVDPTSTARQLVELLRSYGIVVGGVAGA